MATKAGKVLAGRVEEVEALTERYLELRRQAFRDAVDTAIELGQILITVRKIVGRGFTAWLEGVDTSERTARNYVALALLADEQPGVIQRWKELGPSKLYRIARLPAPARRVVLKGSSAAKLTQATDLEFAQIVAPHVVRKRKVTADMRGHGLRMKIRAWTKEARGSRVSGIKDDELRKGLRSEIRGFVDVLETLRRAI